MAPFHTCPEGVTVGFRMETVVKGTEHASQGRGSVVGVGGCADLSSQHPHLTPSGGYVPSTSLSSDAHSTG